MDLLAYSFLLALFFSPAYPQFSLPPPSSTSPIPTTTPSPTCTIPSLADSTDLPIFGYPQQTTAFRATCPRYSSSIALEACPYLCSLPPTDLPSFAIYSGVPSNYFYCATTGVSASPTSGLTYTYSSGDGRNATRRCIACPTALPDALMPTASPVIGLPGTLLRYSCGSQRSRKQGTCGFICGLTEYDVYKGGFPPDSMRCTNDAFYNETEGRYFEDNYYPTAVVIVTPCERCVDDCF